MANSTESINGTPFAQYGAVDKIDVVTASGDLWSIKGIMIELSYYEDIYSFVVSGYVTLKDANGIVEGLQLTGKETLIIDFGNTKGDPRPVQKFRLYSIPKRDPIGNLNSEIIKMYFCSEELMLSEQTKITKSYPGNSVYMIINDIMDNELKVTKTRNIQTTSGVYDFTIPTLKPFEAISWLSTYALPSVDGGADMLFYETVYGFQFQSLGNLYQKSPVRTYQYDQKNVSSEKISDEITTVLDFEFVKTFDSLEEIESGTFANRLISIDPITRTRTVTDFDYDKYKNTSKKLNDSDVLSTYKNKFGETQNQSYTGKLKLAVSNSNQKAKIAESAGGTVGQDIFIEKTIPNRTAQIALANYTVLKLRIPGNSVLSAGDTIQFNLASYIGGSKRDLDRYYSGKYLVTAIRHVIQGDDTYQCVLEIAKESTPKPALDESTSAYQNLTNGSYTLFG